jgi:hypothetical protein
MPVEYDFNIAGIALRFDQRSHINEALKGKALNAEQACKLGILYSP